MLDDGNTRGHMAPTASVMALVLSTPSAAAWLAPASSLVRRPPPIPTRMMLDPSILAPSSPAETKAPGAGSPSAAAAALLQMARLKTLPMSAVLVGLGAFGARHGTRSLHAAQLGLAMLLTGIVTSGSMLINDYHDYARGVDTPQTKPGRPLVSGAIALWQVKLALKWLYAVHLTLLCCVQTATMRLFVLSSTLLTYVYSQHLKPRTGLKNVVCALIIAMAIGLGAMASTDGRLSALAWVWRPMVATFGCIWHREMMMDVQVGSRELHACMHAGTCR